jgi:hypothetical protein
MWTWRVPGWMKNSTKYSTSPLERPDLPGEEAAGPQGLRAHLDEPAPASLAALRARVEAAPRKDVPHDRLGDLAGAQFVQLAEDATQAPPVVLGHLNDQRPDGLRRPRPARLAGEGLALHQIVRYPRRSCLSPTKRRVASAKGQHSEAEDDGPWWSVEVDLTGVRGSLSAPDSEEYPRCPTDGRAAADKPPRAPGSHPTCQDGLGGPLGQG